MKKLRYPIFALFLSASNSYAEEIVMICTYWKWGSDRETRYLKYSNPLFGEKNILNRVDGVWKKWGSSSPDAFKPELSISEKGAVLTQTRRRIANKRQARFLGIPIETPFIHTIEYFLDFEFVTRRVEITVRRMNGEKLHEEDQNWRCRLKDEESQSIKGRIEGVIK